MTIPGSAKAILEELFKSKQISITDIIHETGISIGPLIRIIQGEEPGSHADMLLVYFYCRKKLDGTLLSLTDKKSNLP